MPRELRQVEFVVVHFQLEFQEPYRPSREVLLSLRRGLRHAGRHALAPGEGGPFQSLFDPPLAVDPVALRRYQRPGPPFAILPGIDLPQACETGEIFDLAVVFWGNGVRLIGDFARTLQALGPLGLHRGEGPFELAAIEAEDSAGNRQRVWREGEGVARLAAPLCDAGWWLETAAPTGSSLCLDFVTPARLMHRGKPLFRATFDRLFPFVLRRVTSMLYAHCDLEIVGDPRPLLEAAGQVVTSRNRLAWEDWRVLEGDGRAQDLGGVSGSICLEGDALADIAWILSLGSLMNLGKGAAFGAGRYLLKEDRRGHSRAG